VIALDASTLLESSLHDLQCEPSTSMSVPQHENSILFHSLSYVKYQIQHLDANFYAPTWVEFITMTWMKSKRRLAFFLMGLGVLSHSNKLQWDLPLVGLKDIFNFNVTSMTFCSNRSDTRDGSLGLRSRSSDWRESDQLHWCFFHLVGWCLGRSRISYGSSMS
jgi:hypothetical protein